MLDLNQYGGPQRSRHDLDAIRAKLRDNAASWLPGLFPNAVMSADRRSLRCADLSGRKPRNEGSAIIYVAGDRAGTGHDFANDEHAGPIDLIGYATGLDGPELYDEAARLAGMSPVQVPALPERKPKDVSHLIKWIVSLSGPVAGTKGENYLASRGLKDPCCADLLFNHDVSDGESKRGYYALVAVVRNGAGEPTGGIHRTYLLDDGSGKAAPGKKMLGPVGGGSVRLAPLPDNGHISISEGIETALSVMQIFPGVACWAALSAGNLERWEWPAGVRAVTIYRDAGEAGVKAAAGLAARLGAAGIRCRIVAPIHGDDFNHDLQRGAVAADYEPVEVEAAAMSRPAYRFSYDDFWTSLPDMRFIYVPEGKLWPAGAVDAQLPKKKIADLEIAASRWLAQHRAVEQMTWFPGAPQLIRDRLVVEGGLIDRRGAIVFNLYRPPRIEPGDHSKAGPWLDHIRQIYPDDANHLISCFAHRVQRPGEKINHCVVLGGPPKIGKDTILEPVRHAVGAWNVCDVSPRIIQGRFNGHVKSVVLVISEASDLGDVDRYAFYETCKTLMATPPNVLRVDEKHTREYHVPNVTWVLITTNHRTTGLYLPADDRRHYVTWSNAAADGYGPDYWTSLYRWYAQGGLRHVAAYLRSVDLSGFDPKAPPPKTPAFWAIVDSYRAPEDSELVDILDRLGSPDAITLDRLIAIASESLAEWLRDRKNRRQIPHRMESAGYVSVRNPSDIRDGQWRIDGKRQTVYALAKLCLRDQLAAVAALAASQ